MWLPGEKISGQDPNNEELSDKQMNFGFALGDDGISEPYFYITAYPLPEAFADLDLPAGAVWNTEGFSGAVLCYQALLKRSDPKSELIDLWEFLINCGREHMLERSAGA